jgi:hypothetical protein
MENLFLSGTVCRPSLLPHAERSLSDDSGASNYRDEEKGKLLFARTPPGHPGAILRPKLFKRKTHAPLVLLKCTECIFAGNKKE